MKILSIQYDLHPPGLHYPKVHEAIKQLNPQGWCKPLASAWFAPTNLSAAQARDHIMGSMDRNDALVIVEVGKDWAGANLPADAAKWFTSKLG